MRIHFKKGDIALFVLFAAAAVSIAAVPAVRLRAGSGSGAEETSGSVTSVVVTVGGEEYGAWPLEEDRVIEVDNSYGYNEITIQDQTVSVTASDCANQICVETGAIRTAGEMIVCLPHRLVVTIRSNGGTSEKEYDAISR